MRNYVAAYLDTKIAETVTALNKVPKSDKVVKIYNSPTLKSLQEQIHYARAQGFDGMKVIINDMEDSQEFVSALNESYGYLFKEGIGLVKLKEDGSALDVFGPEVKKELSGAKMIDDIAKEMNKQKHSLYVVNPIGIIPFRTENEVCREIINYIRAAKDFIKEYGPYCEDSIYIADFIPLNNKASTRFNSAVYLKDNLRWLRSEDCTLAPNDKKILLEFFSDEIAIHRHWSTQDSLVHEVGMVGNYLFGPSIFWVNLTGFHLNNNKNINKYNSQVNLDIFLSLTDPKNVKRNENGEVILPPNGEYLKLEEPKYGFYFGWGNESPKNNLTSIENIGDTFYNQFKNCCRELSVNKMVVPDNVVIKASNIVSYLASIISHYVVDKDFRNAVDSNKNTKIDQAAYSGDSFEQKGEIDPSYWDNRSSDEDLQNKLVDKYVLNKEVDGERWVDKTLEKWYNRDSYIKDKLGLGGNTEKYNYKKYDQKARELGTSGYELYKLDKRKKEVDDQIDDYLKEIEGLDDSNKEEASLIKDLSKEIEILKQEKKDLQAYIDITQRSQDKYNKVDSIANRIEDNIESSKEYKTTYNRCVRLLKSNYGQLIQKILINR